MTTDLQMVDTLKTPSDNNAGVLMMSLCYVICKYNDFLNIFHDFWLYLTPVTSGQVWGQIKTITFEATDLLILLKVFWRIGCIV